MTDVDTSIPAPPAPTPPGPGSSFPPPPPGTAPETGDRTPKMLALIALVSLAVAVIMTVLWLGARGDASADDADTTVPAAVEPSDDAQARLAAAQARIADLEAEVAALAAANGDDTELRQAEADLAAAQLELEAATTALDEANATNAELDAALAAANERIAELENEVAASVEEADTPAFDRWIGELLSSRSGSSRLGADDAQCFGRSVVDQIGLDALGAGQNNVATGASRQVVIDAMVSAADACGIDQAVIFS